MGKNAIATLIVGNARSYARHTYSFMANYAKRIDATLIVVDDKMVPPGIHPMLGKLCIYPMFNKYDCIAYLDADVIVSPRAPNIFEHMPSDHIGMSLDMQSQESCRQRMQRCQALETVCGSLTEIQRHAFIYHSWSAGLIVLPKSQLAFFNHDLVEVEQQRKKVEESVRVCADQEFMNYWIVRENYPVYPLPMIWHHLVHDWPLVNRFESYFVHYAYLAKSALPWDLPVWKQIK